MADFSIGDRVEISWHKNADYKGRQGKVTFIGNGMMQGTNPLDYNIEIPDQEKRLIVTLDDNTIVDQLQPFQLRKV